MGPAGQQLIPVDEPASLTAVAEALLRRHRFDDIEHFGPEEAIRAYFPGRDDVRFGGAQRLISATVAQKHGPEAVPQAHG
jgi:hypothetical protein